MIPASELETPRTIEEYRLAVERVRRESAKRRTRAWACVPETVLGLELSPLTPARYSALSGIGNAYIEGRPALEHDLRNFVWFCSPRFNPDSPVLSLRWKPLQMFWLNRMLDRPIKGRSKAEAVIQNFLMASVEVGEIVALTFSDRLPSSDETDPTETKPLAASLEAQFVDMFAREYHHWPLPQPMRHTPIKQLNQMARCVDRNTLGTRARYFDPAEWALDRAFLAALNPTVPHG